AAPDLATAAERARRVLGPQTRLRHYVLDADPIPGVLLAAGPLLAKLQSKTAAPLSRLLSAGDFLKLGKTLLDALAPAAGAGGGLRLAPPLYNAPGPVFLLRWTQEEGHSVQALSVRNMLDKLLPDPWKWRQNPFALLQAVMDHHHQDYAAALGGAADQAERG
ncbi:hypothetical protein H632_c473p0, partial [Helicosporidium sp. ATCC 50920]